MFGRFSGCLSVHESEGILSFYCEGIRNECAVIVCAAVSAAVVFLGTLNLGIVQKVVAFLNFNCRQFACVCRQCPIANGKA
jgi:hypothetical protein